MRIVPRQAPIPPAAGFLAALDTDPYPPFPPRPLDRIRWAMDAPIRSPTAKAVLTVIALHADAERGRAWPSIPTICRMTSYSARSVSTALRTLERSGWLAVSEIVGKRVYRAPQSPAHPRCAMCGFGRPAAAENCPSCGAGGVREMHPWGAGDAPEETVKRHKIGSKGE